MEDDLIILGKAFREGKITSEECFAGHCNKKDRKTIIKYLEEEK